MQKKVKNTRVAIFGSIRIMTLSAMLTAMSVVIGIFCKNFLNFGGGLFRITFENLPILLSGIMFGPLVGGIVGAATDVVSYFFSNQIYPINIMVTIGAASIGVVSGFFSTLVFRKKGVMRIIIPSLLAHIIGSMFIKSVGLYSYYGIAVMWRVPLYFIIAPLEIVLMCAMYKNSAVRKMIDSGVREGI